MRGCLGWLLLWPLVGALWLVGRISDAAAEHGGAWRFVGAGTNLGIGAGVALLGYYLAFRGFTTFDGYAYPIDSANHKLWYTYQLLLCGGAIVTESEMYDAIFAPIRDALNKTVLVNQANDVAVSIAKGLSEGLSRLLTQEVDRAIAHHEAAYFHQSSRV